MLNIRWIFTLPMLVAWLIATSGCSHSPSRQQADQMRLARQADLNYQSGKVRCRPQAIRITGAAQSEILSRLYATRCDRLSRR